MKYVAYPVECDGTIYHSGIGETPEQALNDFTANALCDYCVDCELIAGDTFELGIYEAIKVETLSDEQINNEGIDPDWTWVSGKPIKTETITVEE